METRFKCEESEAEAEVVKDEPFQKVTCNIDAKTSFMMAGMEMALQGFCLFEEQKKKKKKQFCMFFPSS
jgi:hypothetical protein